jgi:hypothetical protein
MDQGTDWKANNINGQNALDLARLFLKSNVIHYLESKGNNALMPVHIFESYHSRFGVNPTDLCFYFFSDSRSQA